MDKVVDRVVGRQAVTYLGDSGRPNNKMMTQMAKMSWTAIGRRHAIAPPA
jgi:hypothetical protein